MDELVCEGKKASLHDHEMILGTRHSPTRMHALTLLNLNKKKRLDVKYVRCNKERCFVEN